MIETSAAVFVTEKTSLIALEAEEFSWSQYSWFNHRDFLSFLSDYLVKQPMPKIKMNCHNAQIPTKWLRGTHYLFTYHEWVSLCQRFVRTARIPEGEDFFSDFRRDCMRRSKEELIDLIENLTGLFRVTDIDLYVVLSTTKPHWIPKENGQTSIEYMKETYHNAIPDFDQLIKDLMRENNATDTDTPE